MSSYSLPYLQTMLGTFRLCEQFFKAPIDLEPLQHAIENKEHDSDEDGSSSGSVSQNYVDFLLPLPEHLQPTETGIPDPTIIGQRRKESGLDNPLNSPSQKARKELKAKAELKNQHKAKIQPRMQRKIKIAPRPGGYTSTSEED
jgi:hypothetical protein